MADSLLAAKLKTTPPGTSPTWSVMEAAVELLLAALAAIGGVAPVVYAPSNSHVTTSGTVASGKHYIEFNISGDFTGSIGGVTYLGATQFGRIYPNVQPNTYGAIAYVVTTGSIDILSF